MVTRAMSVLALLLWMSSAIGGDARPVAERPDMGCGTKCVYIVLKLVGVEAPLRSLLSVQQEAGLDWNSMAGLRDTTTALGAYAKGVLAEYEFLEGLEGPSIAHVCREGQRDHFLVVLKCTKEHVLLVDPPHSPAWVERPQFLSRWDGKLLVISREPISVQGQENATGR